MNQLYKLRISTGLEYEGVGDLQLGIKINDQAVIKCEKYTDYATVIESVGEPFEDLDAFERQRALQNKGRHIEGQKIPLILRVATDEDRSQAARNNEDAHLAHNQTMDRIKAHGLEMKLIYTHYSLDRKLLIFQFSADGRIDFRELLRDLSGLFKVRVELRQVGVRDEASILGGVGICGRPFCCAAFLSSFNSINVKMAKQQGLSLNPQNISGCCGRLKCCLQFEAESYREMEEENRQRQKCPGCPGCQESNADLLETSEQTPQNDEAIPEDMFGDEGTIVTPQQFTVPSASSDDTNARPAMTRQQHQQERRRERQQAAASNAKEKNDAQQQHAKQGFNRPQRNPVKKPLPPADADADSQVAQLQNEPQHHRQNDKGNGRQRNDNERRQPHRDHGNRPQAQRNAQGQNHNAFQHRAPKPPQSNPSNS